MNEMYCAEQIGIPSELGTVLKLLTKSAIRDKPQDVYKWAANYFAGQCNRPAAFDENGKLTPAGRETMPHSQPYVAGVRAKPAGGSSPSSQQQQQQQNVKKQQQQQQQEQQQQQQQNQDDGEDDDGEENNNIDPIVDALFDRYDPDRTNVISIDLLPNLIIDLKAELQLDFTDDQMQDFVNSMETDQNGNVNLEEFKISFFHG